MAKQTTTEEVVLDFKVQETSAIDDLERMKKTIIGLKEEQAKLTRAYKSGHITIEEYAQESVRMETILKKQTVAYQTTQKAVTGHKSKIDELIKSNNKLSTSLQDATKDIRIHGVSVGDLTTKMASFANPATAAVAIVGALGAAYARSTVGAKDLEFATNQLSFATTILTNKFAEAISSAEDGQGLFSKFVAGALFQFDRETAVLSGLAAFNVEKLQDLGREEIEIREKVNGRLEENQEILTKIQAEQTTYNEKISLANGIVSNLRANEDELVAVLVKQRNVIQDQLNIDKNNEAIQDLLLAKKREISKVNSDIEKKVQAILRLEQNINEVEKKRTNAQDEADRNAGVAARSISAGGDASTEGAVSWEALAEMSKAKDITNIKKRLKKDLEKINKEYDSNYLKSLKERTAIELTLEDMKLRAAEDIAGNLASIFDEQTVAYKLFASAQTVISTYSSATKSYDSLAGIPYIGPALGYAAAAAAIVAGLANLAEINNVEFAGGGYTGSGFGSPDRTGFRPAGIVHEGEYVVPKRIVHNPTFSGQIHALESARVRGYADGGLVTNAAVNPINTEMMIANSMKNMPEQVISVREFIRIANRIKVKENVSKIKKSK